MLCPNCLMEVASFKEVSGVKGSIGLVCPNSDCGEEVPLRYSRDYSLFPPVMFSVIGFRGHGKTVFLSSFLTQLETAGLLWPNFSAATLDESGMGNVRGRQAELRSKKLPDSTPKMFIKPAVMRVENVPHLGNCHLLLYDSSGEAIESVSELTTHYGYISRVPVITLLVSLKDLERPEKLVDFLTVYYQTVLGLNGNPKKQSLLVVLTQADKFVDESGLPDTVRRYLQVEDDMSASVERMEGLSKDIETWLSGRSSYVNFVRRAKADFKQVKFCVLSSTGSQPNGRELLVEAAPHGVMAPMLWVMRLSGVKTNNSPGSKTVARFKDFLRIQQAAKKASPNAAVATDAGNIRLQLLSGAHTAWLGLGLAIFCLALGWSGFWPIPLAIIGLGLCGLTLRSAMQHNNYWARFASVPTVLAMGALFLRQPKAVAVDEPDIVARPKSVPMLALPTVAPTAVGIAASSVQGDTASQRARDLKNAAIKEMLQTRRLTEQNLLSEADLASQEQKIKSALQTALNHANKALTQNPDHEIALTQKVAILFLMERFAEAKSTLERGLKLYPDNADLRDAQQKIQKHLASKTETA